MTKVNISDGWYYFAIPGRYRGSLPSSISTIFVSR
jgi:hypothetical protein